MQVEISKILVCNSLHPFNSGQSLRRSRIIVERSQDGGTRPSTRRLLTRQRLGATTLAVWVMLTVVSGLPSQAQSSDIFMVQVEGEGAGYWPRWRGPSGQGVVDGTYPDTWSDAENVAWRTSVPGRGNSSPIVWDDRIFLTTAQEAGRRLSILSYRRSDGQFLWETSVPEGPTERIHPKNTWASATPTADGERVYASFGSRGLMAVDFDGRVVWHTEVGPIDNYHGTAGSPLLYEGLLITYQDQRRGAFVAAHDTLTGELVWQTNCSTGR